MLVHPEAKPLYPSRLTRPHYCMSLGFLSAFLTYIRKLWVLRSLTIWIITSDKHYFKKFWITQLICHNVKKYSV